MLRRPTAVVGKLLIEAFYGTIGKSRPGRLAERRADGGIVRWYLLLTDIEDHKRSEELSRQSQLTIRSIIDSIPGYVHTMRADRPDRATGIVR